MTRVLRVASGGLAYAILAAVLLFLLAQAWFFAGVFWLRTHDPGETSFMARRLDELREKDPRATLKHSWVPYDRVSPHLKRAVVAAEPRAPT